MSRRPICAKEGERGFALLIVFLMAAAIALMLYQQMPRVAFESERDKEQLLIDRGEEYKRAIQLYAVDNKRYPSRLEDLESANNKRYLRKRYIDPFTGKNEWRLVHTNGMMLTDSLVQKPPTADGKSGDLNASNTPPTPDPNAPPPDVNAAVLQRPSDRTLPTGIPGQNGFNLPPTDPNQLAVNQFPQNPNQFPPITLNPIGPNGQPIQQGNGQQGNPQFPFNIQVPVNPADPNQTGQFQPGALQPGQFQPGQTGQPGQFPGGQPPVPFAPGQFQPVQIQSGQIQAGQFQPAQLPQGQFQPGQLPQGQQGQGQFQPGQNGQIPFPGTNGGGSNNAINLIQNLLITPRQPPAGIGTPAQNNTMGAGIAGVASTYKGPSIKAYNKRTKFHEWEFVFQQQQPTVPVPANQNNPNNPNNPNPGK